MAQRSDPVALEETAAWLLQADGISSDHGKSWPTMGRLAQ